MAGGASLLIAIIMVGFGVFALVKQNVAPQYYIDEKGIQREVKFVKINNYLYYDDYTKAVYYQKSSAKAACMVQYVGKHLRPCKYINGRVVEQKN